MKSNNFLIYGEIIRMSVDELENLKNVIDKEIESKKESDMKKPEEIYMGISAFAFNSIFKRCDFDFDRTTNAIRELERVGYLSVNDERFFKHPRYTESYFGWIYPDPLRDSRIESAKLTTPIMEPVDERKGEVL